MRHARRLAALLVSLAFAQILWAGSGFACAMPPAMGAGQFPSASMAGMDMSGDMSGMEMPDEQEPSHHHAPCELPSAPDDCQSMAPCAPLALASVAESPQALGLVPSSVMALAELMPPSTIAPPESPPPRA
ncbi:MAG: hypothetical protein ACT4PJ_01230 [Gemmatimonadaceae bacterium]